MESVAAVGARIDAIQARLASLSGSTTPSASPAAGRTAAAAAASLLPAGAGGAGAGTFAAALAAAQDGAPTVGAAAPAPAAALSAATPKGYGNGRIPPQALASIGGGERLWAPAAAAFERMRDAASAAGVRIGVNDSYRSFDEQVDMARRKGLYSAGGLAAQPGTSDHGWGKALDLQLDGRAQSWMRANGERFGFDDSTPREPWHWVYRG